MRDISSTWSVLGTNFFTNVCLLEYQKQTLDAVMVNQSCSLIGCRPGRVAQTTAEGLRIVLLKGNIQDQTVSTDPVMPFKTITWLTYDKLQCCMDVCLNCWCMFLTFKCGGLQKYPLNDVINSPILVFKLQSYFHRLSIIFIGYDNQSTRKSI